MPDPIWLVTSWLVRRAAKAGLDKAAARMSRWGSRRHFLPEFFPNREALELAYPMARWAETKGGIWAHWLGGTGVFPDFQERLKKGPIKRLLLPDPNGTDIAFITEQLAGGVGRYYDLRSRIPQTAQMARDCEIEVRQTPRFLGYALTIGNPAGPDGWLHFEMFSPFLSPEHRQTFRLTAERTPDTFAQIVAGYELMWAQANKEAP